jgi:hypothetical protein
MNIKTSLEKKETNYNFQHKSGEREWESIHQIAVNLQPPKQRWILGSQSLLQVQQDFCVKTNLEIISLIYSVCSHSTES